MLPDHDKVKVEINHNISTNSPNIWNLNNILLNNPCFREEFIKDIRKYFELKMKTYIKICRVQLKWC